MPIQRCQKNNKPGFKWGSSGTCYTYTPGDSESRRRAEEKAKEQAQAIESAKRERRGR